MCNFLISHLSRIMLKMLLLFRKVLLLDFWFWTFKNFNRDLIVLIVLHHVISFHSHLIFYFRLNITQVLRLLSSLRLLTIKFSQIRRSLSTWLWSSRRLLLICLLCVLRALLIIWRWMMYSDRNSWWLMHVIILLLWFIFFTPFHLICIFR